MLIMTNFLHNVDNGLYLIINKPVKSLHLCVLIFFVLVVMVAVSTDSVASL